MPPDRPAAHPPPPARPDWGWAGGGFALAMLVGVACGWALQAAGNWNEGLGWERALLAALPRDFPPLVDAAFLLLPWLGTNITLMPFVFATAIWLARVGRRDLAVHLAVVQVGSWALNMTLKALFDRERPALWEKRGQYAMASYPSGHAIATVAVLVTVAFLLYRERGWRWPIVVVALLGGVSLYSRLYLGVHWPGDVLAGVLVGGIWLAATVRAFAARRAAGAMHPRAVAGA
jgi:membrane-associated phospholipid phosphatase